MNTDTIAMEHSLWINVPSERIWEAIFKPDQILQWFVPNLPDAQMQRDTSNKITVHLGPVHIDFMTFEAIDAPFQLTLRSLPDRLITTTYLLNEANGGTTVTVRMAGFEALVANAQQERLSRSRIGWEQALKNLDAFVNGAELPFPQAFVSPLFGYWREAKSTLSTERSIWINAPRERVWQAVTDPAEIQRWMSPTTPWGLSALEVGGRLYVRDEETDAELYVQVIELLDPPNRLVIRTVPEAPDSVVKGTEHTLQEENGGTRLTITVYGYEQESEEARWRNMEQDTFGLGMMIQNTKAYVEGDDLPHPQGF